MYEILRSDFEEKLKKAAALKETLRQQSVLSTGSVILGGLRNGMDAYGALASLMFVIATVFLMLSISYPPLLLLAFGSIGMIFLAGFVGLALTTHWQYLKGCGLIKMSVDPETMTADELETLLNKKPAYVLFDAKVYYIDRELKKIELKTKDSEQLEAIFSGHVNELKDASKENLTQITSLTRHIHLTKHSTPLSRADQLTDLLSKLKNQIVIPTEDIQSIKDHIDRLTVVPSPQYFFQEWFEVLRLLCSGGGKGMRSVDETMVAWQDIGDDGHYHDTWIMAAVAWFFAAIFGVSFALRGFARLGRNNKTCAEAAQDAPSSPVSEIASPLDSTSDSSTDSVISNASQNDANAGISPLISIVKNPVNNIPDQNVALSSPRPATPKLGVGAMLTTFFSPKPLTKTNNSSFSGFSSLNRIDSESKSPILVGKVVDSEQDHCTFYIDDTSERSSSAT